MTPGSRHRLGLPRGPARVGESSLGDFWRFGSTEAFAELGYAAARRLGSARQLPSCFSVAWEKHPPLGECLRQAWMAPGPLPLAPAPSQGFPRGRGEAGGKQTDLRWAGGLDLLNLVVRSRVVVLRKTRDAPRPSRVFGNKPASPRWHPCFPVPGGRRNELRADATTALQL